MVCRQRIFLLDFEMIPGIGGFGIDRLKPIANGSILTGTQNGNG